MDFGREAVVLVVTAISITMAVLGAASTVHTVGDIGGWNSDRDVDYYDWAASREFHIGDIIHFKYDAGFHNVVEVRRADYHACNAANPIATYSSPSGNDYIKIERHGHYFFICGCVDHCALTNQKVDIRVPKDLDVIN